MVTVLSFKRNMKLEERALRVRAAAHSKTMLTIPAQETSKETDNIAAPSGAKTTVSKSPMHENKNTARANLKQNFAFDTGAGELLNNDFQS